MKTMKVFQFNDGRYLRVKKGNISDTFVGDYVDSIDDASKSTSDSFFNYIVQGDEPGKVVDVNIVTIEPKHKQAMHYLKDLLDKELAYAQEQEDTAELPEDRKDYRSDGEKIQLLKELFGL